MNSLHASPPIPLPATLNQRPPGPHPDSEDAVQLERNRTAHELDTIVYQSGSASHSSSGYRQRQPHEPRSSPEPFHLPGELHARPSSQPNRQTPHWYDDNPITKFWNTQINVTIDEGAHRDHLALERTFLAYLRTSLALATSGVVIAQLFRLQHTSSPNPVIGFFVLGVPLAVAFIGIGIVVLLLGAYRFWRQQNAMVRGKVYAGGWEIVVVMGLSALMCTAAFALVTAVNVTKRFSS